jgi:predicted Zn-ribbon and HTH transcriptional regulator
MQTTNNCPLCASQHIETIYEHVFNFPGGNVYEHLLDATYVRLWILFERIIKNHNDVTFRSFICKNCGFIFTNPRFSEEDLRIKYETIIELGSVKYRLQHNPPSNLDSRAKRNQLMIPGDLCSSCCLFTLDFLLLLSGPIPLDTPHISHGG